MQIERAEGDILDTRFLAGNPEGERVEWRLIVGADTDTDSWHPYQLDEKGEVAGNPVWAPLPGSQLVFLQCPVFEALYEGNRGGGKTLMLIMDFAREVGKGFGNSWRGILFRREYKELDDIVKKIEEWFPLLWPGFRFLHSKAEYMAIWPTGETLMLRAGENEEAYKTHHGQEYPWIGFEELTQWEDDILFLKMQSCCRASKPGMPCRVRSTTNPYGPGHNWVKKRYNLPRMRGKVIHLPGDMPRVAIHGYLKENFLLLHATPNYITVIRNSTKNPNEAKAWIDGDWDVTSGGMIDDLWDERVHVVATFPISDVPPSWTLTRAYDHGQSSPFSVGWWLESSGEPITVDGKLLGRVRGDLILWREWYGTNGEVNTGLRMAAKKIANGICDREEDWGVRQAVLEGDRSQDITRVIAGPADTEIYNRQSDRDGRCPADDMEDVGVYWERADKSPGSRKRGWEMLRTLLDGSIPSEDGTREDAGIFVCDCCIHFLELVPVMPRDTVDPDDVPKKYEDHIADMVRYRINWEIAVMWRKGF